VSENTKIEWADHTFSPWRGCTKVSAGCANCYAETLSKRNPAVLGQWGKGKPRVLAKNWNDPVKWDRQSLKRWDAERGNGLPFSYPPRTKVFPSLCDWLDDEVPIEWLARFLGLIQATPNLDWLLLTKRPENWYRRIYDALLHVEGITDPNLTEDDPQTPVGAMLNDWLRMDDSNAPRNVWVGTSVEDQANWDKRASDFLKIPAKLRFLSVEPMLGPIEFSNVTRRSDVVQQLGKPALEGIGWVIFGGESGPDARPCNVDWIRSGVKQCLAAGVPCFVKQLGAIPLDRNDRGFEGDSGPMGWPMDTQVIDDQQPGQFQGKIVRIKPRHPKAGDTDEWPEDLRVRQMPVI